MTSEMSPFSERLCAYIKSTGLSVRGFERSIDVSNGWVSDVKSKVDIRAVSEISLKYPDLNIRWLFTGEGSMLRADGAQGELVEMCRRLVALDRQRAEAIRKIAESIGEDPI